MEYKRKLMVRSIDYPTLPANCQQALKKGQSHQSVADAFGVNVRTLLCWRANFINKQNPLALACQKPCQNKWPGRPTQSKTI
jgi:transposase-like protein